MIQMQDDKRDHRDDIDDRDDRDDRDFSSKLLNDTKY